MRSFLRVLKQMITETRLAYASIVLALVLGIMTYAVLSSPRFLDGQSDITLILLGLDVSVLLILSIFVFRRIINLFRERKRRLAGYQLHWRLAILFSIISVIYCLVL